jgi:hypothetical protein
MNERADSMSSFEHVQLDDAHSPTGHGEAQPPSDTPQKQKPSSAKRSAPKPEQQPQQQQQTGQKTGQKKEGPAADPAAEPAASAVAPSAAGASPAAAPEAGLAQQSLASVLGFFNGPPLEDAEERGPGEPPDAVEDFEREAIEAAKEAAHAAQEVRGHC